MTRYPDSEPIHQFGHVLSATRNAHLMLFKSRDLYFKSVNKLLALCSNQVWAQVWCLFPDHDFMPYTSVHCTREQNKSVAEPKSFSVVWLVKGAVPKQQNTCKHDTYLRQASVALRQIWARSSYSVDSSPKTRVFCPHNTSSWEWQVFKLSSFHCAENVHKSQISQLRSEPRKWRQSLRCCT